MKAEGIFRSATEKTLLKNRVKIVPLTIRMNNNSTFSRPVRIAFALVAILLLGTYGVFLFYSPARSPVPVPTPFNATTPRTSNNISKADIDERLFLIRLLAQLYSNLPGQTALIEDLKSQETLNNIRYRATVYYEYIIKQNLDDELSSTYKDLIDAVDAYSRCLSDISKIKNDSAAREEKAKADSTLNAGKAAANSSHGLTSAIVAVSAATMSKSMDDESNKKIITFDEHQAIAASEQNLQNKLSEWRIRACHMATTMAQRYQWKQEDTAFDDPPNQSDIINSLIAQNNFLGALDCMNATLVRRPSDPFAMYNHAVFSSNNVDHQPKEMAELAEECAKASTFVPPGRVYDDNRFMFLFAGGDIATRASTKEIGVNSWAKANNSIAAFAVSLWDECLKYANGDAGAGERRAWALMQSGNLDAALKQARSLESPRRGSIYFAYNYSRLLSDVNDYESSFKWFEYSVKSLGYNDIKSAQVDPDLTGMRNALSARFNELTSVKYEWKVRFGLINDDIVFTNHSAFPLTNLTLKPIIISGTDKYAPDLKPSGRIEPNASVTWSNCISVKGSHSDSLSEVIQCDQGDFHVDRSQSVANIAQESLQPSTRQSTTSELNFNLDHDLAERRDAPRSRGDSSAAGTGETQATATPTDATAPPPASTEGSMPELSPERVVTDVWSQNSRLTVFNFRDRYSGRTVRYTGTVVRKNRKEQLLVFKGGGFLTSAYDVQISLREGSAPGFDDVAIGKKITIIATLDRIVPPVFGVGSNSIRLNDAQILNKNQSVPISNRGAEMVGVAPKQFDPSNQNIQPVSQLLVNETSSVQKIGDGSTKRLTASDISGLDLSHVQCAIDEIYGHYGVEFPKHETQVWADSQPWYHRVSGRSADTAEQLFTEVEKFNIELLAARRDSLRTTRDGSTGSNTAFMKPDGNFDFKKIENYLTDSYKQCLSKTSQQQQEQIRVAQRAWIKFTAATETATKAMGTSDHDLWNYGAQECIGRGDQLKHFYDTPSESLEQLQTDWDQAENNLTSVYHKCSSSLSDGDKSKLIQAERAWVDYKEKNRHANAALRPEGQGLSVTITVVNRRIEELKAIYRQ